MSGQSEVESTARTIPPTKYKTTRDSLPHLKGDHRDIGTEQKELL